MRTITQEQAEQAYYVLVRAAGACADRDDARDFVHHVAHPYDPAPEYRFGGALGLGGKFRNDGNFENTPHVTCYIEDLDDSIRSIIHTTNRLLAELFPPQAMPRRARRRSAGLDDQPRRYQTAPKQAVG